MRRGKARLSVLAAAALVASAGTALVVPAVQAGAGNPPVTWTGQNSSPNWSAGSNWSTNTAPASGSTLSFPNLGPACNGSAPVGTCYTGTDNISGLSVQALQFDASVSYLLLPSGGINLQLGSGGLSDQGSGSSGGSTFIGTPLSLSASQTWSLGGVPAALTLQGGVNGSGSSLGVNLSSGAQLTIARNSNVGALTATGQDTDASGPSAGQNGTIGLDNGVTLNGTDGNPVNLNDTVLTGTGSTGPLTSNGGAVEAVRCPWPPLRARGRSPSTAARRSIRTASCNCTSSSSEAVAEPPARNC